MKKWTFFQLRDILTHLQKFVCGPVNSHRMFLSNNDSKKYVIDLQVKDPGKDLQIWQFHSRWRIYFYDRITVTIPLTYCTTFKSCWVWYFKIKSHVYRNRSLSLWSGYINLGYYTLAMRREEGCFLWNTFNVRIFDWQWSVLSLMPLKFNLLGLTYTVIGELV